jgi:Skp family chaperone for outer membrane proteins
MRVSGSVSARGFRSASFAGAAALLALLGAAPAALAQPAATSAVVVDLERVFAQSLAGKDAQTKLQAIAAQAEQEFAPEAKAIAAEQTVLGPKFNGLNDQQANDVMTKDPALAAKYKAFVQRTSTFEQKRALRQEEIAQTERAAVAQVVTAAVPDVQAAMTAKGAAVAVDTSSTAYVDSKADVTADVIARLDQRVKTVTVTKVDLTKAQQ